MNKRISILIFLVLSLSLIILLIAPINRKEQAFIDAGERLYKQTCASCHGDNGKAEGQFLGTALNNQLYLNTFSNEDIFLQIKEGRPEAMMPEYGSSLNEEEINQLVAFIRNWQTEKLAISAPTVFDGDSLNGKNLYSLYCANCHGITGSGLNGTATAVGNPHYLKNTTDAQIWISTAYGREDTRMGPSLLGLDGVRQLESEQITDIVTFIRQELQHKYNPEEKTYQPQDTIKNENE
ncbi:c-type cytochrome [Bacillus sp. B15-48]|uniref:c-type cytochrome n=1 Tax=Bacillus sp. B15-48 TaxID=1548601 RepID=UPI00193F84AF|nr:c-type cytochrome [Bacillus sp. B15-48]MBM4762255.1 c-type cytochrome [Bacillus sp. B15-48]